jgi:hypothetical protein
VKRTFSKHDITVLHLATASATGCDTVYEGGGLAEELRKPWDDGARREQPSEPFWGGQVEEGNFYGTFSEST